MLSLVLGVALVVVDRHEGDPVGQFGAPLTDEQAIEQVVGSARQIVAAAHLEDAAVGYSFVSCATQNGPPYQVTLYMNFALPQSDWIRYLDEVASAMVVDGWADAPATRPLPRCGCTASAATPGTIGTTTPRGPKSLCDSGQQETGCDSQYGVVPGKR